MLNFVELLDNSVD